MSQLPSHICEQKDVHSPQAYNMFEIVVNRISEGLGTNQPEVSKGNVDGYLAVILVRHPVRHCGASMQFINCGVEWRSNS